METTRAERLMPVLPVLMETVLADEGVDVTPAARELIHFVCTQDLTTAMDIDDLWVMYLHLASVFFGRQQKDGALLVAGNFAKNRGDQAVSPAKPEMEACEAERTDEMLRKLSSGF